MPINKKRRSSQGFTLIEILVVIGMIAILAAIVIVAINPARQFAQGRNTQRSSNVEAILNGVGQRLAENKGVLDGSFISNNATYTCPPMATGTPYDISSASSTGNIDLSCLTPTYIPSQLPVDPGNGTWVSAKNYDTKYDVAMDDSGRFTVWANGAELGASITLSR